MKLHIAERKLIIAIYAEEEYQPYKRVYTWLCEKCDTGMKCTVSEWLDHMQAHQS